MELPYMREKNGQKKKKIQLRKQRGKNGAYIDDMKGRRKEMGGQLGEGR